MSFKAKDLSYDSTQPAFLRRLRGELAGDGSGRHERPIPRNKRLKQDDEDDGPTYVLEENNESLSRAEYEALVAGKDSKGKHDSPAGAENQLEVSGPQAKESDQQQSKDCIAEVGRATKKRKAIKVIVEEEGNKKTPENPDTKVVRKPKKKAKPVKLSFDDQEEG
ncbi:hypothetical protein CC78DRAFT_574800 [Lojkania enalia]|uniref:DUF4604 domain-containing protein n=1 Tax=Lojkania enalia TaxID=147567 RepID=A0A9P4TR23_9PLEO|nr:hypothetical protein CC78DRAFT_574800 [Didymosphaeria enalia]